MKYLDDNDNWEEEIEEIDEPVKFRDHVTECPNCKKPITEDMDNCPYCGDILFRYLKNGTFVPRKGPLAKIVAVIIILTIILGILAFIIGSLGIL